MINLMKKRDEIRNKQQMEAITSSDRSLSEMMDFIKGRLDISNPKHLRDIFREVHKS